MKKLGLFMCALAALTFSFTSCEKKENGGGNNGGTDVIDVDNQVADGMYVIGEAVGVTDVNATAAASLMMATGVNEKLMDGEKKSWVDAHRAGMYEKYLYLEGQKDFTLVLLDGDKVTKYGGNLQAQTLTFDAGNAEGYWCALEQNKAMQVPQTGFYHVVLDLNLDNGLDATGGAQIIVAPVAWGICGDCAGSAWQKVIPGTKDGDTWTWTGIEFQANQKFKFKDEKGWKIWLDGETQQISAHANLGENMQNGGADIVVADGGLYTITLTYKMAKGDIAASYAYNVKKTGEIEVKDYSEVVMCVVGNAVAEQTGAEADPDQANGGWPWGNRYSMGKPAKDGNVYTWTATLNLLGGENAFKIRSYDTREELYLEAGVEGGSDDITVPADGTYTVTFTFDAVSGVKNVTVEGEGGAVTPEKFIITVRAKMPSDWTNTPTAWVWATGADGAAAELTQDGDWWVYTTPEEVTGLNIIYRNGNDWGLGQTVDITGIKADVCLQIGEADTADGEGKRSYTEIDCE